MTNYSQNNIIICWHIRLTLNFVYISKPGMLDTEAAVSLLGTDIVSGDGNG